MLSREQLSARPSEGRADSSLKEPHRPARICGVSHRALETVQVSVPLDFSCRDVLPGVDVLLNAGRFDLKQRQETGRARQVERGNVVVLLSAEDNIAVDLLPRKNGGADIDRGCGPAASLLIDPQRHRGELFGH